MPAGRAAPARRSAPAATGGLLVYDGDCGFCTSAARWAKRGFRHGERAEAWQLLGEGALAACGLTVADVQQAAWWVAPDGSLDRGHRAVGRALEVAGGWRRGAGRLVLVRPTSWVAAAVYALVVRYRYRLPGGTPACRLAPPPPDRPGV